MHDSGTDCTALRTTPHNMHRLKRRLRHMGYRATILVPATGPPCIATDAAHDLVRALASQVGAVLASEVG